MVFNEVMLRNFGIYRGEHCFDLRIEPSEKNIILINAKNGSGKTTLLTGIKVGLYGPLLMGYRHINPQYQSFITDKMNINARLEGENRASIVLNFSFGGYGTAEDIILERSWLFEDNHMIEKVRINKDGKDLSPKEIIEFENFTRKFLPPSLFDFFLFDGEQIHHQLEEGIILQNIRYAFNSLFNLDLTALLKEDLHSYLNQDSIFKKLDKEQQNYNQLLERHKSLQTQLFEQISKIESMEEQIENHCNQSKQLELEFKLNDGLAAEERNQARLQLMRYEQKKREVSDWLKATIAELLPFHLVKGLLFEAKKQVTLEFRHRATEVLTDKGLEEIKARYMQLISNEKISITKAGHQNYSVELWDSLISELIETSKPQTFIHDLNDAEKEHLFSLAHEIGMFNSENISKSLNKITKYNKIIYQLTKKIEINNKSDDLNLLLQQINNNNLAVLKISNLKEQLLVQHNNTNEISAKVEADLDRTEKIIQQSTKNENIFSIISRIDKVLSQFKNEVAQEKTETMRLHFLKCFMSINHKDNFVKNVNFDFQDNNFKIHLFDENGSLISYNQLSAGEKQIFLLSLTWALLKASQREVPLFFDTLLGRLDQNHRENIIQKFLPNISQQVVVLSTDTEIDDYYYELIKPHISFEYDLSIDQQTGNVTAIKKSQRRRNAHAV